MRCWRCGAEGLGRGVWGWAVGGVGAVRMGAVRVGPVRVGAVRVEANISRFFFALPTLSLFVFLFQFVCFVCEIVVCSARFKYEMFTTHIWVRFVVLAGEVSGRWSEETRAFIQLMARARTRNETALIRRRAEQAWRMKWWAIFSCAAAGAFAASLLG